MNASLIPSHTGCANCPHAADEHVRADANRDGAVCMALDGNTPNACPCPKFQTAEAKAAEQADALAPLDGADVIALADADDIVTTIPRDLLAAALRIALVRVADTHDDEWDAYGEAVNREALEGAVRGALVALA